MGLFFQQMETDYKLRGTGHWEEKNNPPEGVDIRGKFCEKTSQGRINSMEFLCNEQSIFFFEKGRFKSLDLCLTTMEERFSLMSNQRVYEIKLKRKNLITLLFTTNLEVFTTFYTHLAKYCILRNFDKHFRLTSHLGSGSLSRVYNGQNIFSREEVALKVFNKEQVLKIQDGCTIIENEIVNLQKLRKFNLSPLIETYETNDCVIIVMQKAEAGNMFDYLKQHANDYDEALIRAITMRVLENLCELHAAGFIHRDIKPENILFKSRSSACFVFFGDYGLTVQKEQCRCSKIGQMCSGTMGFVAPEVLRGNSYDEKCDLFSLGCLFYFLHKGESLFMNRSQQEIEEVTMDDRIIERKIHCLDNLTIQSKELMTQLLKINPEERFSAQQALSHSYFSKMEHHKPMTGEQDHTLRDYLSARIDHFYS